MTYQLKGLVSKIYKELTNLNTQETNNPIMKGAEDMNRHFSIEDLHMASKCMRKCCTSLANREIQIETTMGYHLTPVRMMTTRQETTMLGRMWEMGTLLCCWLECKVVPPLWKTVWQLLKKLKIELPYNPCSNCITSYLPQRYRCSEMLGQLHPNIYSSIVHNR